jgi:hypothetical protein
MIFFLPIMSELLGLSAEHTRFPLVRIARCLSWCIVPCALFMCLALPMHAEAATITAAAGGGNWNSTSTWVGGAVPTAADDVVLDGTSGPVTITAAAAARSLDAGTYANTLTHNAAITLSIGDSTAGAGNIALRFGAGMTYTLGSATTSAISFVSTNSTQQSIDFAGKTPGNVSFGISGGSWKPTGWTATSTTVTLVAGALTLTDGESYSWSVFTSNAANIRTLALGSASISSPTWRVVFSNLTMSANTATITGNSFDLLAGSGGDYNGTSLVQNAAGTSVIGNSAAITLANYTRTGTAVKTDAVSIGANLTITNTLTLNGNSTTNRLLVQSSVIGTPRTITAANVSASNVDFMDITGAGAGSWDLSAISGNSGDAGGNSGITFTPSTTQTHTASAGGNASDVTKWTSRVPLPQDDVIIDGNTTGTWTSDMPRIGKNLNFTGFTGTWLLSGSSVPGNSLYGSLTLASGMTLNVASNNLFFRGRSSHTITSAGKTWIFGSNRGIRFQAPNGFYTLLDAMVTTGSTNNFTVSAGTFDANDFNVTCASFDLNALATTSLNMGNGTWTVTSTGLVWDTPTSSLGTINPEGSTIVVSSISASSKTFVGGGRTFNNLTITGDNVIISSNNTFNTLAINNAGLANGLKLAGNQTVANLTTNGSAGNLAKLLSSVSGTQRTLTKTSGTVAVDYMSIQDSNATGGATWYAGANSTDVSGNSGWVFSTPAPSITSPVTGSATNDSTPAISGTGSTATYAIRVYSGATLLCSTTVNNDVTKSWSCNSSSLADGTYSLHATENSGTESAVSNTAIVMIDATAPAISTLSPADDATGALVTENLVLTFTEVISTVGTGTLTIRKSSDDSIVQTIAVTGSLVTGSGTAQITINPSVTLDYSTAYNIRISETAFPDAVGNKYAGIGTATVWNFTTEAAPASSSSSAAPSQNSGGGGGGGRRGSTGDMAEKIAMAYATILARFDIKRDESERLRIVENKKDQREESVRLAEEAATRREARIAARIAEHKAAIALLTTEKEQAQRLFAERREDRLARALALSEKRLAEEHTAFLAEQRALEQEQLANRKLREQRLAQQDEPPAIHPLPSALLKVAAARRGRLFAVIGDEAVLYADVLLDAWYAPYVASLIDSDIAHGYKSPEGKVLGEFGVDNPVTYAELLKMAQNAAGVSYVGLPPPRNTFAAGTWASPYVAAAEAGNLSLITPALDVNTAATRAEVIRITLEVFGMATAINTELINNPYTDLKSDHPHANAILTATLYGLIRGDTGPDGATLNMVRPDAPINRAEVAKIIALLKEVMKK